MTLINEILDLAKIESGTMAVEIGQVRFAQPARLRRPDVPPGRRGEGPAVLGRARRRICRASIDTDDMRLRQVLRNLLSNAMKFTERGRVNLRVSSARRPTSSRSRSPIPASASRRTSSG